MVIQKGFTREIGNSYLVSSSLVLRRPGPRIPQSREMPRVTLGVSAGRAQGGPFSVRSSRLADGGRPPPPPPRDGSGCPHVPCACALRPSARGNPRLPRPQSGQGPQGRDGHPAGQRAGFGAILRGAWDLSLFPTRCPRRRRPRPCAASGPLSVQCFSRAARISTTD